MLTDGRDIWLSESQLEILIEALTARICQGFPDDRTHAELLAIRKRFDSELQALRAWQRQQSGKGADRAGRRTDEHD
jgi:hypothetical protein